MTTPFRSISAIVAIVATGLILAACGSDNATGPSEAQVKEAAGTVTDAVSTAKTQTTTQATTTTAPPTTTATTTTQVASADGKAVFTENCSGCHTLADAGASGAVGPNLDERKPSESTVETKVTNGGGGMPPFGGQLSPEEIKAVAAYVSSSAG